MSPQKSPTFSLANYGCSFEWYIVNDSGNLECYECFPTPEAAIVWLNENRPGYDFLIGTVN